MQYVTKVRTYMKEKSLEEAVEQAIEECIEEDILREFLLKNKKEAMEVCIFEYDEEATIQYIRECEFSLGKAEGIEQTIRLMLSKNRTAEQVAEFSGISIETVKEIERKMNNE